MNKLYDIAICDATSLSGETLIRLLEEKAFPLGTLYPVSDTAEKGASIEFLGEDIDVLVASRFEFTDVDLVVIPVGATVDEVVLQQAMTAGCMMIDGSLGAAEHSGAVVVLPGLNEEALDTAVMQKRVVVPSSPVAMLLTALEAITRVSVINRVDITACQSVSRQGNAGIDSLRKQTVELLNGKPVDNGVFPHRMAYNLIPQIGRFSPEGLSAEELMIETEIWAGLNDGGIDVRSTCVVAPVFYGDSLAVTIDMDSSVDITAIRTALAGVDGVTVYEGNEYPTVEQAAGGDDVMIGRLRGLPGKENALSFWVSGDAVRQGALATLSMAERLISDFL